MNVDKSNPQQPTNYLLSGDEFLIAYGQYRLSEGGKRLSEFLNRQVKRIDKEHFSYRIINHWEKNGLLIHARPEGKGWRKFSLMDIMWIHLMGHLRKFGFPLEKIKEVQSHLLSRNENESSIWGVFEFYVAMAISHKMPVYVLIFEDGKALPATYEEYYKALSFRTIQNHILININDILQKLFPHKDLEPKFGPTLSLSEEEFELMFMLRMEDYEEITIKQQDGKIVTLEASKHENIKSKVVDLLQKDAYQSIEVKQADGKVVCIKRTKKKKF